MSEHNYESLCQELLYLDRLEKVVCELVKLDPKIWRSMDKAERVPLLMQAIQKTGKDIVVGDFTKAKEAYRQTKK